ncbi:hypothetical protein N8I77_006210 [Diaporthe amygdali]|uniref:Aminoglycoside phosphotransferase domain-containing protein n=1 Tax=Phomopsis amygdali TaxID=1214568 RepID=A0AAD9SG79_PHOAM|nr:hypothetical protein N8I77_006210 [Diaporthe amygdali]
MPRESQDGLEWEETLFNLIPRWTREPSMEAIESVCRRQLELPAGCPCTVSFYAAGAFNKLYLIVCADQSFLMRVTLPVSPHYKTRGEVATLRWVREHTDIPVPRVIAFEDSNDNSIGFEWILMELMPGATAYRRWRTMSLEQKSAITKRVAEFQVQLSRYGVPDSPFKEIGTLDLENGPGRIEAPTGVTPGKLISHEFFMGNRLNYDVPRGPFRSSFDWLSSEIRLIILEQTEALEKAEDDDDREDAEEILGSARRLLSLLPKVFPDDQQDEIATALYHDDLSLHNILVNEDGEITAIVDWECVSAMPIWLTTKMPKFLIGENREEEPIRGTYADEIPAEPVGPPNDGGPDDLNNEGKNQLYWIHLMEYETTQLRAVYEARLRQLWPAWPLQESQIKVDFFDAVLQCSAGVFVKQVDRWVDSIERGDLIRWADA